MGESDFNQFMRLKSQLVIAAGKNGGQQTFPTTQILTRSRDMNEQHKLTQRVVDVAIITNRMICMNMLRYNVDKPESSYSQVRMRHEVSEANMIRNYV